MSKRWEKLVLAWAVDDSLPLYVRKYRNDRGSVRHHDSGRDLVPTDDSPARWSFILSLVGKCPSIKGIRRMIAKDQIPIAKVIKKIERPIAQYKCTLKQFNMNSKLNGWKVAHILDVGLPTRSPLEKVRNV